MKSIILKAIGIFTLSLLIIMILTQIFPASYDHRFIISNINVATNMTIYAVAYMKRKALKSLYVKMVTNLKLRLNAIK